jgi:hypothetical protein
MAMVAIICIAGPSSANLISYSANPNVPAGPVMYEDRSLPWDGEGVPQYIEYGSAPKTVFTPQDYVYISVGLDITQLTVSDMVVDVDNVKQSPRERLQLWVPGQLTSEPPTFDHMNINYSLSWDEISDFQDDNPGYKGPLVIYSFFPDIGGTSDLWTLAGGYQPGVWNYRLSLEALPVEATDPWFIVLSDGSWSGPYLDTALQPNGNAPISGSGTAAVPEPATMLLLCSGLIGLVAFRRRFKK